MRVLLAASLLALLLPAPVLSGSPFPTYTSSVVRDVFLTNTNFEEALRKLDEHPPPSGHRVFQTLNEVSNSASSQTAADASDIFVSQLASGLSVSVQPVSSHPATSSRRTSYQLRAC